MKEWQEKRNRWQSTFGRRERKRNVKLKEVLEKHKGEMVKVGAGSSFIYCAEVNDNTIDTINKMSRLELERLKRYLASLRKANKNFRERWKDKPKTNLGSYLRAQKNDRKRIDDGLRELPNRIDNFVMFPEREVLEEYPSIEGGTIIIFEGCESGSYWTYNEYKYGRGAG